MPKKQSRNAFWYFMSEWKMLEEKKGRKFPNGYRDVQADPKCNEAWRALSTAQKAPYVSKAKSSKFEPGKSKQTGTGESIELIKQEEQKEQDFKLNMDAHIRHIISNAKKYNSLTTQDFVFIHMNWYYMRVPDSGPVDFCPAEFAVAEFSIADGVTNYYHEIVRTDLHLGYTREAMETSERTHKLHWDLVVGEADWAIMYHKMITFLDSLRVNGKLPPLYTAKKNIHVIPSLLRRMTGAVGKTPDMFLVYSIETLFGNMLRAVTDHPDSNIVTVIAETQLDKELYAYTPNIECDYHKTQDGTSQFCSLSVVRQWAFEFCDQCCKPLGIDMLPGIHCPETEGPEISNRTLDSSLRSLVGDRPIGVLSATGVSEQHRIAVSERKRKDETFRCRDNGPLEIIDHSLLTDEERPPKLEQKPIAVAVPVSVPTPVSTLRAPVTASQALMGRSRVAPLFNGENFPAIGGRGTPIKKAEPRRMEGPIWSHRERKGSESD